MPFLNQAQQLQQQQNNNSNNLFSSFSNPVSAQSSPMTHMPKSNTMWSLNNLTTNLESANFFQGSNCSTNTTNSNSHSNASSIFSNNSASSTFTSECDETNHLWFCLRDYSCTRMDEFLSKLKDYIRIFNNRSELILVHTAYPIFEYKNILGETRRLLALFLGKFTLNKCVDELIDAQKFPVIARQHVYSLLNKFLNVSCFFDAFYLISLFCII